MPQEIAGVTLVHTLSHPERSEGSAFPQRPSMGTYHVYIMASRSRTLYVGVTNDLARRVLEHKAMRKAGFTSRYRVTRLVFFSEFEDAISAIEAEKVVKKWRREKKIALIESINPSWVDLSEGWVEEPAEVDWPVSEGNADPSLRSG